MADRAFFNEDMFCGDDSCPEGFTKSEEEIKMPTEENVNPDIGLPDDSYDEPRGSGVEGLYTAGDDSLPEPMDSSEMYEGGEDDNRASGIFGERKKRKIAKGNLLVQRKINDMYDQNLIYSETMQILLEEKNLKFMY